MAAPTKNGQGAGALPMEETEGKAGGDVSIRRIEIINVVLILAAVLAAFEFWTRDGAIGIFLGGTLSAASFRIIAAVIRAVLGKGVTGFWPVFTYWLKYLLMMGMVGILVLIYRIDAMGLLIGLSVIVPSIFAEAAIKLAFGK